MNESEANIPPYMLEKLLLAGNFKYGLFSGLQANIKACAECLPREIKAHGFNYKIQCGEAFIFGHIFFTNEFVRTNDSDILEANPKLFSNCTCDVCKSITSCYELRIDVSLLEAFTRSYTKPIPLISYVEVRNTGLRGKVTGSEGWQNIAPYKTIYTVALDNGKTFEALGWQLRVLKENQDDNISAS